MGVNNSSLYGEPISDSFSRLHDHPIKTIHPPHHFVDVNKMIVSGSGSERKVDGIALTCLTFTKQEASGFLQIMS